MVTKPESEKFVQAAVKKQDEALSLGERVPFGKFTEDGEDRVFVVLEVSPPRLNKWNRKVCDVLLFHVEAGTLSKNSVSENIAAQLEANRRFRRGKETPWPLAVRISCGQTDGENGGQYRVYSFEVMK